MEKSLEAYRVGEAVKWRWGEHMAEGKIAEVHTERVERTIKGAHVVRNGEPDNPAYLIEQDSGAKVLKKHSELFRG